MWSIRRALFTWALFTLGLAYAIAVLLLYQSHKDAFYGQWHNQLGYESLNLATQLQHQLPNTALEQVDRQIAALALKPYVTYAALYDQERVLFSTQRQHIHQPPPQIDSFSISEWDREQIHQLPRQPEFSIALDVYYRHGIRVHQHVTLLIHYNLLAAWQQQVRLVWQQALTLLLLALLFLFGLTLLVRQWVLNPLQSLLQGTQRLRQGELGVRIEQSRSHEFGQLSQAFNDLSTHLKKTDDALWRQHRLNTGFADAFPDIAFVLDHNGQVQARFGQNSTALPAQSTLQLGQHFSAWLGAAEANVLTSNLQRALATQTLVVHEFRHDDFYLESRVAPLRQDRHGLAQSEKAQGVLWLVRDISELKRKQQQIEYQANYDPLTDLANRRLALRLLEQKQHLARQQGQYGSVLFIDIDHFKDINDSLGHDLGDALLIQVGQRLQQANQQLHETARLGGDEFLVVSGTLRDSPEMAAQRAYDHASFVLTMLREPFQLGMHTLHISASMGIAVFPCDDCQANDYIRQADTAMYFAKSHGRSTIRVYTDNMQQQTQQRLQLFNDLHEAIKTEAFSLVFQPQCTDNGDVLGAEVLCRWIHHGQFISPEIFIAAAEDSQLIIPLGKWIFRESCLALKRWQDNDQLPPSFERLAINISPSQFMDDQFIDDIQSTVQDVGVCPHRIELELTENVFMGDKQHIRTKMQQLVALGFALSLDDFGTGYSSLSYLQQLPLHKLKIDRSFIHGIDDQQAAPIVASIIQMSHNLGLSVIAEGVETDHQRAYLSRHGCHQFQGYWFSKPLNETDFCRYLTPS